MKLLFHQIEPDICAIARSVLNSGDTVLDIGANVGLISRIFAEGVGETGRVLAFEPDPHNASFLKSNVRKCRQVKTFEIALSDRSGTASLFLNATSGTGNTLAELDDAGGTVVVECLTLDDFLKREPLEKIHLIKIDVEGYETRVLSGMTETLKVHPEAVLIIEYCPKNLQNAGVVPESLLKQLADFGLELDVVHEDGSCEKVDDITKLSEKLPAVGYVNLLCAKPGDQRVASLPRR